MNFNSKAHKYDSVSKPQLELAEELFDMSLEYLPDTPPTLLDIGCGTGHLSLELASLLPKSLDCLDISKEMLEICREKLQINFPNIKWRLFESKAEDFEPDTTYDAIYCNAAIQWFKDLPKFLANLKKWLKPHGILAIGAFGDKTLEEVRGAYKEAANRQLETKAKFYSQKELLSIFKKAGFSLENSAKCIYTQDFETPLSALKTLGNMGVTGVSKKPLNRAEVQGLKDALLKTGNEDFPVCFSWELMAMVFRNF